MKPGAVRDLKALMLGMDPTLGERAWVFVELASDAMIPATAFAIVREEEGMCAILPATAGPAPNSADKPQFARITLQVHSDLEAVGLTAAVATTLATYGIACNIVAGLNHDHLFVPWDRREEALKMLKKLSMDANRSV